MARYWSLVLRDYGFNVRVHDFSGQSCRFADIEPLLGEHKRPADAGIYIAYPSYVKTTGNLAARDCIKIGVFVTEAGLSEIERSYAENGRYTRIIVPSTYCKRIFNLPNVDVVNHGISNAYGINTGIQKRNRFTYLFVFNSSPTGGTSTRKNLHKLLQAWDIFKQKNKDADLLIKTCNNIEEDVDNLSRIHDVTFERKLYSEEEMCELYNSCHVYINPTSAEGFGITPLEAMACGLPLISTIHTGMTDYLTPSNCIEIPSEIGKDKFRHATNDGFLYNVVPVNIARSMQKAYDCYEEYKNNSDIISKYVIDKFSWNNVMMGFVNWLKNR